ncbi:hypothetical protein [Paraburkholderia sp. DGU8]|uniref:hypothetical protein n=1 Tax=Paraburkholderia sp. DGU8 TaxID=3161997 RepID=UPI00346614F8
MSVFTSDFPPDPNVRIEAMMEEGETYDWKVVMPDGVVLFEGQSQKQAMEWRGHVARLSRKDALGITIERVKRTPEYVGKAGTTCPESRFCQWALRQVGHVAVFAFSECGDSSFLVIAETGQRAKGDTLAQALFELINQVGVPVAPQSDREQEG